MRALAVAAGFALMAGSAAAQSPHDWPPHDPGRSRPPVVDPGPEPATPAPPPADAIVLFGASDLSAWQSFGDPARWRVGDGWFEVVPGAGELATRDAFGDVQLHIEWASPAQPEGDGQNRGNSGVFLMGRYEVQVLDSWKNETYADGQAAAIYGQYPPLVNASRSPGEWQSYDIVFRRPRFDADGELVSPAVLTVFHNGVLVQDAVELTGPTAHRARPDYAVHPDRLPLVLQDHGQPVRFRNVWVRNLER